MYIHSLLIAASIIFVFIAPIAYFSSLQKRKAKKEILKLEQFAQKNALNLDFSEALPSLLLGMDAASRKLLVVELINEKQERILDLRNLNSCEIYTDRSKSAGGINLIALKLNSGDKGNPLPKIVFYNEDFEVNPDAERRLQAAEKWKKIISANINI